jgi:hypothetical protein
MALLPQRRRNDARGQRLILLKARVVFQQIRNCFAQPRFLFPGYARIFRRIVRAAVNPDAGFPAPPKGEQCLGIRERRGCSIDGNESARSMPLPIPSPASKQHSNYTRTSTPFALAPLWMNFAVAAHV